MDAATAEPQQPQVDAGDSESLDGSVAASSSAAAEAEEPFSRVQLLTEDAPAVAAAAHAAGVDGESACLGGRRPSKRRQKQGGAHHPTQSGHDVLQIAHIVCAASCSIASSSVALKQACDTGNDVRDRSWDPAATSLALLKATPWCGSASASMSKAIAVRRRLQQLRTS